MQDNIKIAAVVVTYNRLNLLKECIDSLRTQSRQLDEILIINNSSNDGTETWLQNQNGISFITQENSGGAGGFYTGIKTAYEKGYDWIWCMDDDACAEVNTLRILLQFVRSEYSAVCPLVVDKNYIPAFEHRGFFNNNLIKLNTLITPIDDTDVFKNKNFRIELTSFVGPLINRSAIKKIGYPISEYFIHNDDIEYSFRLAQYGPITMVPGSLIVHKAEIEKDLIEINVFFKKLYRKTYESYWVKYYTLRNYILTLKKHGTKKGLVYISIYLSAIKELIQILCFDDKKWKRTVIISLALYDGITGQMGRKHAKIMSRLYSI